MAKAAITALFGATVRHLRSSLGLSQEELAERADLHRTYIAGIEGGRRNVTLKSIAKLAKALEVSTAELLSTTQLHRPPTLEPWAKPSESRIVNILLVEDNPSDVELTLEAFRQMRIANHVDVASDGAQALDHLFGSGPSRGHPTRLPQLILLDLHLPKISGFDVLRRIKNDPRTRRIPVIVLTVSQKSADVQESRRLGAEHYIVKPVDFYNFTQVTPQLRMQWALCQPPISDRVRNGGRLHA